jgi:hypothetical protein
VASRSLDQLACNKLTGLRRAQSSRYIHSVPKGLQDSARGFNPGNMRTQRPALKGRKVFVVGGPLGQPLHTRRTSSTAPQGGGVLLIGTWGLKPQAESCSPFGTKHGYQAIDCLYFGELSRVATFIQSLRDKLRDSANGRDRTSNPFSILTADPVSVFAQLILIFVLTFFVSLITDQVVLIHFLQTRPLTLCVPASLFGIFADRFWRRFLFARRIVANERGRLSNRRVHGNRCRYHGR